VLSTKYGGGHQPMTTSNGVTQAVVVHFGLAGNAVHFSHTSMVVPSLPECCNTPGVNNALQGLRGANAARRMRFGELNTLSAHPSIIPQAPRAGRGVEVHSSLLRSPERCVRFFAFPSH